ncbi:filamin-A-like [Babylonia areolata]|uniref:filamin-A-like n=1 Tax=Babylonia areolata TaxID=304850 RepID=UPI003FD40EB6
MPSCYLHTLPVSFYIDTRDSGSGNIEIKVNGGRVPCAVEKVSDHRFMASFLPEQVDTHTVTLTFNDQQVEGSPWTIRMVDPQSMQISASSRQGVRVGAAATVTVTGSRGVGDGLTVTVTGTGVLVMSPSQVLVCG